MNGLFCCLVKHLLRFFLTSPPHRMNDNFHLTHTNKQADQRINSIAGESLQVSLRKHYKKKGEDLHLPLPSIV